MIGVVGNSNWKDYIISSYSLKSLVRHFKFEDGEFKSPFQGMLLKRVLYLSDIKSAAINKMSVKARIDNYFYKHLLNKTFTPSQIGEYLEKIYELETDWSDYEWISENYSLARTGVFSLEDADNRLRKYLKDNASCNLE